MSFAINIQSLLPDINSKLFLLVILVHDDEFEDHAWDQVLTKFILVVQMIFWEICVVRNELHRLKVSARWLCFLKQPAKQLLISQ